MTGRQKGSAALAIVCVAGLALRGYNLATVDRGFDAPFILHYIADLDQQVRLPAPDSGYSTSDPPFFYALATLVMRGAEAIGARGWTRVAELGLGTLAGLACIVLAAWLARGDPPDLRRALLAAALLLYLPAHVQMSAMLNEEIWHALLTSAAIVWLASDRAGAWGHRGPRAAVVGVACGLALLTKLSGALVSVTAVACYALDRSETGVGLRKALTVAGIATIVGGWFFLRNKLFYGFFHPFGLEAHHFMFTMPPGDRSLLDFIYIPLSTFWNPQLLDPQLLRSVWGSLYATVWFDGHRFFLPDREGATLLGRATTLLALVPTAAFIRGLAGGSVRAWRGSRSDRPLVALVALTFFGVAVYNWRNPWIAAVKGTHLLGLCVPFAYYTSETLIEWSRSSQAARVGVVVTLAALWCCVALSTSYGLCFEPGATPGLPWLP